MAGVETPVTDARQRPHVVVAVLNWYGRANTAQCLRSLAALSYPNWSAILIDNGCQEFSSAEVASLLPQGRYMHSEINRGFAGGANLAIHEALAAGADYVLLVNNDATPEPDALAELIAVAERDPSVGIVGAKLLRADMPGHLEALGVRVNLRWGRLYEIGFGEPDDGRHDRCTGAAAVSGGAMLLRRSLCEQLGGFDERYFCYLEDVDLCLRARRAGFRVRVAPGARVHHQGKQATGGVQSALSIYYATRNHFRLMHEHGVGTGPWRYVRPVVVAALNVAYALRGDMPEWHTRLRAVWWGMKDYRRGLSGVAPLDVQRLSGVAEVP